MRASKVRRDAYVASSKLPAVMDVLGHSQLAITTELYSHILPNCFACVTQIEVSDSEAHCGWCVASTLREMARMTMRRLA